MASTTQRAWSSIASGAENPPAATALKLRSCRIVNSLTSRAGPAGRRSISSSTCVRSAVASLCAPSPWPAWAAAMYAAIASSKRCAFSRWNARSPASRDAGSASEVSSSATALWRSRKAVRRCVS